MATAARLPWWNPFLSWWAGVPRWPSGGTVQHVVGGLLIALALAVMVSGVIELLTGWIHPWERARVVRPVPHGLGQMLVGSGLSCLLGGMVFASTGDVLRSLLAVGITLLLGGSVLLGVSQFPDR